jgi:hypothetical protein
LNLQMESSQTVPRPRSRLILTPSHACRGPDADYENLGTELERLLAGIDGDKTDAIAAAACVAMLQDEAATAALQAAEQASAAAGAQHAASGAGGLEAASAGDVTSMEVKAWAEHVCAGAGFPALEAAAASGDGEAPVAPGRPPVPQPEETATALRWARYAVAAYGMRQYIWLRGKKKRYVTARREVKRLAREARLAGLAPLAGWVSAAGQPGPEAAAKEEATVAGKTKAAGPAGTKVPSKYLLRDFAAARQLQGQAADIVSVHSGEQKAGLLPHMIALDRC